VVWRTLSYPQIIKCQLEIENITAVWALGYGHVDAAADEDALHRHLLVRGGSGRGLHSSTFQLNLSRL
jgi:hypothetical protein